jgi:hypothetical protein
MSTTTAEKENQAHTATGATKLKEKPIKKTTTKKKKNDDTQSEKLDADWISQDMKQQCGKLQKEWEAYYQGDNAWGRDRSTGGMVRKKPVPPNWQEEVQLIQLFGLLQRAGCKFKQSWKNVLQFVCLNRKEAAASVQWYKLQKEPWRLGNAKKAGKDKLIVAAKKLALTLSTQALRKGVPSLTEHPWAKTERVLLKRGIISDSMSESEKRQKICMFQDVLSDNEE